MQQLVQLLAVQLLELEQRRALCIAARDTSGRFTQRPVAPCGSCRQVMVETEYRFKQDIRILLYGLEGIYCIRSAREMLPVHFDGSFL